MPKPNRTDGAIGVYGPKPNGKWEVRYTLNGRPRSRYRDSKEDADAEAARLAQAIALGQKIGTEGFSEVIEGLEPDAEGFWLQLLAAVARRIAEEPANEDYHRASRAIATIAGGGAKAFMPPKKSDEARVGEATDPELAELLVGDLRSVLGRLSDVERVRVLKQVSAQ